jgi:L-serine dehydratase
MIGPSSSHTAGAAKIGYMALKIFGMPIHKVLFELHGSFAETYQGHGTDKALLAGILGIHHNDERLSEAFERAEGLVEYQFEKVDLGEVHPNTVRITMTSQDGITSVVQGCSIGGGHAMITEINEVEVEIDGTYDTIITVHKDQPGMVATLSKIFAEERINIAYMKLYRETRGMNAIMVLEVDESICKEQLTKLKEQKDVYKVTWIPRGD